MIQRRQERQVEAKHKRMIGEASEARVVNPQAANVQRAGDQRDAPKPKPLTRPTLETKMTTANYDLFLVNWANWEGQLPEAKLLAQGEVEAPRGGVAPSLTHDPHAHTATTADTIPVARSRKCRKQGHFRAAC